MTPRRPTILLFDLDGTLVSTGGAGRRALQKAFAARYGAPAQALDFSLAGMTDRAIARQALAALAVEPTDAAIVEILGSYVERLDDELRTAGDYRILPGVAALLESAGARAGAGSQPPVAIGLGTGNLVAGARKKLAHADLWRHFPFGGFADDSEERATLIRIGAERGAARLDQPLGRCRVVVIGDTPRDIDAARANGFEAVAVATGPIPAAELRAHRPDHCFDHLDEPAARTTLLGGA